MHPHQSPEYVKQAPGWLNDPRNICIGRAKVPWADATDDDPSGWVLPGGFRTRDEFSATRVAEWIATRVR